MKALLKGHNLVSAEELDVFVLFFPDIPLWVQASGRDVTIGENPSGSTATFWQYKNRFAVELDIPFDVVARLYCEYKDYRIKDIIYARHIIWEEDKVRRAVTLMNQKFFGSLVKKAMKSQKTAT